MSHNALRGGQQWERLFHGSSHEFAPGDVITPSINGHAGVFGNQPDAYATAYGDMAQGYARMNARHTGGSPHVYEVVPAPGAQSQHGVVTAPGFAVMRRVHPHEVETLPKEPMTSTPLDEV